MERVVHGLYVCAAILTVSGREIGGASVDDATEVISITNNLSKVSELHVDGLAYEGDLGLLWLKLPLSA